ncbi:hypothetical protein F8M41_019999 [Gigaspora margarita]|uniref:Uncharacterized protein n=1 Tax=Gigaspora margarita TaxID=4874 RepID=A0A8H4EK74_GIGMA|nr:hypothetical protein F8M41_019999 [Gigaspora margarita]
MIKGGFLFKAFVTNLPRNDSDHDDILFSVETKDFIDQDSIVLRLECYYLKLATHLVLITNSLKKRTMLFMNKELLIINNTYIAHLCSINFCEYQKATLSIKKPVILLWLSSSSNPPANEANTNKVSVTHMITLRVKNSRQKKYLLQQNLTLDKLLNKNY